MIRYVLYSATAPCGTRVTVGDGSPMPVWRARRELQRPLTDVHGRK